MYQIMSEVGVHLVLTCSLIMKLFRVEKRAERICSSSIQWNVYHCPDFHQPALGFIFLEQEAANKVEVEEKPTLRRKQPASPGMATDQFRDRMANWLLYKGVNDHTKKYCQGRGKVKLWTRRRRFVRTQKVQLPATGICCTGKQWS